LYLDARGAESRVRADAASFCAALARVYGMAIGSATRAELEGRRAALEAELRAAREAQQLMMPPAAGELRGVRYAVRSVPGQFVAGDLFDAAELSEGGGGRVAVSIGDVSGHGAGPAIMMASTQAYLNAVLARVGGAGEGGVAGAVGQLNRYVCARSGAGRFVSLWAGVVDAAAGTLTYVDAGHGHWLLVRADGSEGPAGTMAAGGRGIPLGIDPEYAYAHEVVEVRRGDRVVLYSDGLLEQRSAAGEEFGPSRIRGAVRGTATAQEAADALMRAVEAHAGRAVFDDDTTIAVVEVV
jgi:sigma-B regulation protein RsbU (phosphoserine phosphatase)